MAWRAAPLTEFADEKLALSSGTKGQIVSRITGLTHCISVIRAHSIWESTRGATSLVTGCHTWQWVVSDMSHSHAVRDR